MLLFSVAGFGCHRRRPPPPQSCRRRKDRQFPHLLGSRHRPVVTLCDDWIQLVGLFAWEVENGSSVKEKLKN
jgi:hypothetical protein